MCIIFIISEGKSPGNTRMMPLFVCVKTVTRTFTLTSCWLKLLNAVPNLTIAAGVMNIV